MKHTTIKCICGLLAATAIGLATATAADMSKPVKVFILMGQSNMVGMGNISGSKGETLENAVKAEKLYPYLVDVAGNWLERNDVRNVQVMVGRGGGMKVLHNEWLKVGKGKMGIEFGAGHVLGDALAEPVMLLKSCIGMDVGEAMGKAMVELLGKQFK